MEKSNKISLKRITTIFTTIPVPLNGDGQKYPFLKEN